MQNSWFNFGQSTYNKHKEKKISNSIKGINHPNYGKHISYETRKVLSAKFLNRVHIVPQIKLN